MIIISHSRKELVRRQKAVMDYINRRVESGQDPKEAKCQEAVNDFQRWNAESKQFKSVEENPKAMNWVATFGTKDKAHGNTK